MKRATKESLRSEIGKLRFVGGQMANLCFNLAQARVMREGNAETMDDLWKQWDAIERAEKIEAKAAK